MQCYIFSIITNLMYAVLFGSTFEVDKYVCGASKLNIQIKIPGFDKIL